METLDSPLVPHCKCMHIQSTNEIICCAAIPVEDAEKSTHVAIVITARGGHIGFLEGAWPNAKDQYMARLFSEFFGAVLREDSFERTSAQMLKAFQLQQVPTN